jgi:hypothetical protein
MPIPLGVLAVAGAGAAPSGPGVYEWLETISVGTAVASVEFTNVNTNYGSTYQHLQVRLTSRTSASDQRTRMRLNGDSGQNYATHLLFGNGSSVSSAAGSSFNVMSLNMSDTQTSVFGAGIVDLLDAFETTKNKTIRHLGGISGSTTEIALTSGVWLNTAAITTITLRVDSGNLQVGSRFSLYGIRSVNP